MTDKFNPCDPAQLDALMELANGATPGPWETGEASWNEEGDARYTLHGIKEVHAFDCQFIAASREAVPALIEEVKRFRKYVQIIAMQKKVHEVDEEDRDDECFKYAYDKIIDTAREALKAEGV
ncbi:hypothetical protein [Micavibrio aeruginosavorus]|uniref:Uncharacterized protein n=1 Tax=Micavibrio aeruginosavorus (strain ARL-13) TaxID=856793 RepID=G2KMZ7_MICAA|nr:hypothetical protein [Micavibrio aeruginosavorus]AEP08929.1 hypothetical protein MICA_592 [Micavibrio aeruginosavorus ARL-13]